MVEKKRAKKPHEIVPLMLRLREALRQRLAKDAEKAAKSLNAEIVDRLEAAYSKDERIEELRKRLEDVRPNLEAVQTAFEKDRARLDVAAVQRELKLEELRGEITAARAKFQAGIAAIEAEASRLQGADALLEGLLGENKLKAQALRLFAIAIAKIPDDNFATTFEAGAVGEEVKAQLKAYVGRIS
jgi:DNA repair exonuclease SbcCD ATPase subunit